MTTELPDVGNDAAPLLGLPAKRLALLLAKAEAPEHFIRSLPAQSLFLVLRAQSLPSCVDMLETATIEQLRLLIDLDLWQGDQLSEERLFDWLAVTDATNDLALLQRILSALDLKIVAHLIARHVEVRTFGEPETSPPEEGFTTPDKGLTWLRVLHENPDHFFLINRLLALLFQTNADLFYQLLAIPTVTTLTILEEEAFTERTKRLVAEGFPDEEIVAALWTPIPTSELRILLAEHPQGTRHAAIDVRPVAPLIYAPGSIEPLSSIARDPLLREQLEEELTLLMNASAWRWGIPSEAEPLEELARVTRGLLNIGIEYAVELSGRTPADVYGALGAQVLFRFGVGKVLPLHKLARKRAQEVAEDDSTTHAQLEHVKRSLPFFPLALNEDTPSRSAGAKPFEFRREVELAIKFVAHNS